MNVRLSVMAVAFVCAVTVRASAQQSKCSVPSSSYGLIQAGIFEQHGCTQTFCHGSAASTDAVHTPHAPHQPQQAAAQ